MKVARLMLVYLLLGFVTTPVLAQNRVTIDILDDGPERLRFRVKVYVPERHRKKAIRLTPRVKILDSKNNEVVSPSLPIRRGKDPSTPVEFNVEVPMSRYGVPWPSDTYKVKAFLRRGKNDPDISANSKTFDHKAPSIKHWSDVKILHLDKHRTGLFNEQSGTFSIPLRWLQHPPYNRNPRSREVRIGGLRVDEHYLKRLEKGEGWGIDTRYLKRFVRLSENRRRKLIKIKEPRRKRRKHRGR